MALYCGGSLLLGGLTFLEPVTGAKKAVCVPGLDLTSAGGFGPKKPRWNRRFGEGSPSGLAQALQARTNLGRANQPYQQLARTKRI